MTDKAAPNDVDVVVLPGNDYPRSERPISDEELRFPFLQIMVAVDDEDLERWALEDFGTDRARRNKGVVEVIL